MDPLNKSITVNCPPAAAYEFFTNGLSSWWPLHSHSVFGPEAVMCSLEARAGGRITERNGHGGTRVDLEHGDWQCLGQAAQEQREAYDTGWDVVLGQHFAQTANR